MQNEKQQNITKSEQKLQKLALALKKNLQRRKGSNKADSSELTSKKKGTVN